MQDDAIERPISFRIPSTSLPSSESVPQTPKAVLSETLRVEIFPIYPTVVPPLVAYQLDVRGGELAAVGAKFAIRCADTFPGGFLWTAHRLVTDLPPGEGKLGVLLKELWDTQPHDYGCVFSICEDHTFQVTAQVQADFVADCRCAQPQIQQAIRAQLARFDEQLGRQVVVSRQCVIRGRVVNRQPALSISIRSRIFANQNLRSYARQFADPKQMIGVHVWDRNRKFKGEIVDVYDERVTFHRNRLLGLTSNEITRKVIENAADDELVVQMRPGKALNTNPNKKPLDYVASALTVVVRVEDCQQFGITAQQLLGASRLSPADRSRMVKSVSAVLQREKLIEPAFNSADYEQLFLQQADYGYAPHVLVGRRRLVEDESKILSALHRSGFYSCNPAFSEERPIQLGLLSALPADHKMLITDFCKNLRQESAALGFPVKFVESASVGDLSRAKLEQAVSFLRRKQPDLIVVLLPEKVGGRPSDQSHLCQDEPYYHIKDLTVGRGVASQVITTPRLINSSALPNIALGVLVKVGNIPFRLAEPLPYADMVVGLDIARMKKGQLSGSMNTLAMAQIYQNTEPALRYLVHDALIEGETIPESLFQKLFSYEQFAGKRVVVHRDGFFRGKEREAIKSWGQQIGATFSLVEVIKSGAPRFYRWVSPNGGPQVIQPAKGSAFRLNDQEALLVSSLPPSPRSTPDPLYIRTEAPFPIEDALHSVLTLTLLHYGSVRAPRLPITTHYSDRMASLALRGVRPPTTEGVLPYWV